MRVEEGKEMKENFEESKCEFLGENEKVVK